LTDGNGGLVYVSPSNQLNMTLDPSLTQITGPVHVYNVSNNGNGALLFQRSNQTAPAIQASPTVKQGVQIGIVDNTRMVMN